VRDFPHFNILISIPTKARPEKKITAHIYTDKKDNPNEAIAITVGGRTTKNMKIVIDAYRAAGFRMGDDCKVGKAI